MEKYKLDKEKLIEAAEDLLERGEIGLGADSVGTIIQTIEKDGRKYDLTVCLSYSNWKPYPHPENADESDEPDQKD